MKNESNKAFGGYPFNACSDNNVLYNIMEVA
jgi:hypothetical protein